MISLKYPIVSGEYKISQPFGSNPGGFPEFYMQFGYKGHNGIDFYGVKDDYIFAACDGTVFFAGIDSTGYGNLTIITDADGGQHYYGHQNSFTVKAGDRVNAGTLIGYMGNTGNVISGSYSDGTHLHYGYRPAGYDKNNGYWGFIDPMPYFEKKVLPEIAVLDSAPGWAEIICDDGANVRAAPGGQLVTWFPKAIRVYKTGDYQPANGPLWEQIDGGYWIARSDITGNTILEDIK